MSGNRRSSEENVMKKAKINKSSSKDSFERVASDAHPQVSSVAAASVPPSKASAPPLKASAPASKDSSARSTLAKPAISIKAPVVFNLMDIVTSQKGGGQGSSKASSAGKDVPPKSSVALSKGTSSSSAEAGKSTVPEKAKIQDKNVAAATAVPDSSGSKAKIQDKSTHAAATTVATPGFEAKIQDETQTEVLKTSAEAQIQDKGMGEGANSSCLSSHDLSELRQIYTNLRPLSDRSGIQLPYKPQIKNRDIVSPSRGGELFLHTIFETMQEEFLPFDVTFDSVEVAEGSSLACDEVPANTFVMSAQAVEPFVTAANRIWLPQVEDELMLQDGDTLYKSLLSSQVKSLAITHASLRQYKELSRMKADRDSLRKDLSVLETKVKEKEEALALSNKRLADLSSEKEALSKSAKDFELKVASLDKQVEKLDASLAKVKNINDDLRGKVDAANQELTAFAEAEKLCLFDICDQIRDALVSVGLVPDQLPEGASIEYYQAWLTTNIPYVIQACRAFSNNVVHLAVRDLLRYLEAGGSDALAKADSSDFSLSEFATPKDSPDLMPGKSAAPESSSDVSLSEFATPEPSSHKLAHREPPVEIFSSPSEIDLSSDSEPLSPVEGGEGPFTFPPGSLVAIGRVYRSGSDAPEGRHGRGKRGSRERRPVEGSSSSRGATRKRDSRCRRDPPVDSEGPSSRFDAASHVERMLSSGVVDPVFRRPYSPSSGYDIDEFSIVCQMLIKLGLIVKQELDDGSP
ncbi:hypothetical protein EJB05_28137, partial [Eragrostis curvula]